VESLENSGVADSGEDLRNKLSEKIAELEKMQWETNTCTTDEINAKIKEISQLQKSIEEHHKLLKNANEEKQNAIDELNRKTKEMKKLKIDIEKEYTINKKGVKNKRKKRTHIKYKLSISHTALKKLEGIPQNSFLTLAKSVILIDGKAYNEDYLPLTTERKNDFRRLIEHYAVLEITGKRKYHIKRVYTKKQRDELNEKKQREESNETEIPIATEKSKK